MTTKKSPPCKACPKCFLVLPAAVRQCYECGHIFPSKAENKKAREENDSFLAAYKEAESTRDAERKKGRDLATKPWCGDLAAVLVPVIFANGRDDDTPGLKAAMENKRVVFGDRIYEPGELITISHQVMRLSASCFRFPNGASFPDKPVGVLPEVKCFPPPVRRNVVIRHCTLFWGAGLSD